MKEIIRQPKMSRCSTASRGIASSDAILKVLDGLPQSYEVETDMAATTLPTLVLEATNTIEAKPFPSVLANRSPW